MRLERYHSMRHMILTGDVIEMASAGIGGGVIRMRTGYDVNHTALVLRANFCQHPHLLVLEARGRGVVLNRLSRRLESCSRAYWLELSPEWDCRRDVIAAAALEMEGRDYDFGGLFKNLFGRVNADASRLFCSELAYFALLNAGLPVGRDTVPVPGEMGELGVFMARRKIL
jgi:hypothetical protein